MKTIKLYEEFVKESKANVRDFSKMFSETIDSIK